MSGNSGHGVVPSGFFAPQKSSSSKSNNNHPHHSYGASSQQQQQQLRAQPQFGYVHNYGQPPPPPSYYPYSNGAPQQMHATSTPTAASSASPSSRKRPREASSCTFRCEPCGLDLDSAVALESHKKSHVKCTACDFQGAPKVVKGHYQAVHGKFSGQGFKTVTVAIPGCPVQRFRICVGNRPEDVQKWIADRKKKFPRTARPAAPPANETKVEQSAKTEGLASLLAGYSSSEDEKEGQQEEDKKPTVDTTTCAALSMPKSSPLQQDMSPPPPPPPRKKPCHSFVRHGKCRRGEACPYSHDESLRRPSKNNGRKQNSKKKDLLSNLLESDVDRERKLSLQVIHYLVHSEFLKKRI